MMAASLLQLTGRPLRIAVFRALQLGDMLCIVPALRALRAAVPDAQVTLIGLPWAHSFAQRFSAYINDFLPFPGFPGFPEHPVAVQEFPAFLTAAQQRRFDLALQMHGSGRLSNPITVLLGARQHAGFYEPGQYRPQPGIFLQWRQEEHEVIRYLGLMAALGAPARGEQLEFPLTEADRASLQRCALRLPAPGSYACIHPGARLASRRWFPQHFAAVADRLAQQGLQVVVTGSAAESEITSAMMQQMSMPAMDMTGKTDLGALALLVAGARIVVCNDTGISHIAAAVGTPSVVVCSGADPQRWAPLDQQRHRLIYHPIACRPCMHEHCPLDGHPCAGNVSVEMVWQEAQNLLTATPGMNVAASRSSAQAIDAAGVKT